MSRSVLRVSIIALGVATFVSSSPLSAARADTSAQPAPAPSAPAPSLAQPAPTPDFWVESGPDGARVAQHAAMLAITRATTHGGTGVAMLTTVTTLWRPPRPARPAASPIWARLPLIHSIASRTTAPALSVGRIGFEARAPQVAFRLESVIWERRNAAGDYRESVCRRRRCECRLRPASDA